MYGRIRNGRLPRPRTPERPGSESVGGERLAAFGRIPCARKVNGKGDVPAVVAQADVDVGGAPFHVNPGRAVSGTRLLASNPDEIGGNPQGGSQIVNSLQAKRTGGIDGAGQFSGDGLDAGIGLGRAVCAVHDRDTMDMAGGAETGKIDGARGRHDDAAVCSGPFFRAAGRHRDAMRIALPAITGM